ncbi:hypothetical protein [Paraburkholderia sp. BL10I2N1]|uniref:hypothetical protein n=1 Tax=Paraburkholderia sp. BL10I2N1 TaxID=1938796 RepID=UPI00105F9179|nr:hypothetical protein [Paraburkholderia sp. BL10I2N1]TDN62208.1 hypothetical protein B0G77_5751 [Paraburkholderia sp. BL10I2N1]
MTEPRTLTREQMAALLCYLATAELAVFALQGTWLTETRLVESARLWLARNQLTIGGDDRIAVAQRAHDIAADVVALDNVDSHHPNAIVCRLDDGQLRRRARRENLAQMPRRDPSL